MGNEITKWHLDEVDNFIVESRGGASPVGGRWLIRCFRSRAAGRLSWARFLPPLSGRVGSWRAAGRGRWLVRRFRAGPQSGARGHVSSSRLVKPSVPLYGTGLSCWLRPKVYVTIRAGSAFGRSPRLLHLFRPNPSRLVSLPLEIKSPSSGLAPLDVFIIPSLPSVLSETRQQQGAFAPRALPRLHAVGSEEARPAGAGLRPPLKRYVRFSRIPLSRRRLRVMRTDGGIKEWTLLRPVGFSQSASLLGR